MIVKIPFAEDTASRLGILMDQLEKKEDDLDTADDGEPGEESHGASDETQLGLNLDLLVSLDVVEGRRVKEDLHQLKSRLRKLLS